MPNQKTMPFNEQINIDKLDLRDAIVMSRLGEVGSQVCLRLLSSFGSVAEIMDAAPDVLRRVRRIDERTLAKLLQIRTLTDVDEIIGQCNDDGITIVSYNDPRYPAPLRSIADPPAALYVRGTLLEQDSFAIAVIGTRKMSVYGKRMTNVLTDKLARAGLTIVSGLARGIDGVAHFAALNAGGRTIAVLGGGHRHLFPAEHIPLADNIVESGGAVISEYPPMIMPSRKTFPQRNRIVSGLSLGVVVIEAPIASGTMITARLALEQGRELFAVPGQADQENSHGCHSLIRDGATLAETADDIINTLGPLTNPLQHPKNEKPISHPLELQLNEIEKEVLQFIDRNETPIELIIKKQSNLEPTQITAAISVLAKKGIVRIKDGTHAARLS